MEEEKKPGEGKQREKGQKLEESEQKILEDSKKYAESKGFALNPDSKVLGAVIKGLASNQSKHGKPYCPCRAITGNPGEDEKSVCPCAYHEQEIVDDGHCKCRLFWKK